MLYNLCLIFMLFIIYSFIGWIIEIIEEYITNRRFVNRGYLIGPYCPIYGFGGIAITLVLTRYSENVVILFVMSMVICSVLEYLTSYIMEKIFKTRWWDYSKYKFNINGRICLETMVGFATLGCICIYLINPALDHILHLLDENTLIIIAIIIFGLFIIDFCISTKIIFNFRKTISNIEKDSTAEITKKVREVFISKGLLHRRLIKAFPNMKNYRERLLSLRNKLNKG